MPAAAVGKPGALGSKQHAMFFAVSDFMGAIRHRFGGRQNLLVLAPLTGGGRPNEIEVENRVLEGFKKCRGFEQMHGAGRGGISAFSISAGPGPALAGRYQTEILQPEIGHRPRAHANVDRELRAHQDHCRAAAAAFLGTICSGARHWCRISESLPPVQVLTARF